MCNSEMGKGDLAENDGRWGQNTCKKLDTHNERRTISFGD